MKFKNKKINKLKLKTKNKKKDCTENLIFQPSKILK